MWSRLLFHSFTGLFFLVLSIEMASGQKTYNESVRATDNITIFMCGDVMTGRGVDQVLPHPSEPAIYEPYMKSAKGYVEIAERVNGPIKSPVSFSYIWGDAMKEFERLSPDIRIINLETSVTESDDYWKGKGINYRMHPENITVLTSARINYCSLANNHILDWGYSGLKEAIKTLRENGIKISGAGMNLKEAETPAIMDIEGRGRVIIFSYGAQTSGIPLSWSALEDRPGVNLLKNLSDRTVQDIKEKIKKVKKQRDILLLSIHWGGNWGYDIPDEQIEFAHKLIDDAGVDIIHGHSSHHIKGIEVYHDRLIIYGCGDFINDYEGISGYEGFRDDLTLMYFVNINPSSGRLVQLEMSPMQIKNFKLNKASSPDTLWMRDTLNREGKKFGTRVELIRGNTLELHWE